MDMQRKTPNLGYDIVFSRKIKLFPASRLFSLRRSLNLNLVPLDIFVANALSRVPRSPKHIQRPLWIEAQLKHIICSLDQLEI